MSEESLVIRLVRLEEQVKSIERELRSMEKNYVRADVFNPVKAIVFGLAGIMLTSVAGAILSQVISK